MSLFVDDQRTDDKDNRSSELEYNQAVSQNRIFTSPAHLSF